MAKKDVALPVIRRLPRYYRFVSALLAEGIERISSKELSLRMGLTASQIRQDLNCFGGFGQQGYGYNLKGLKDEIGKILGIDKKIKMVLVGAGNIGRALGTRVDFNSVGFELVAIFDNSEDVVGKEIGGLSVKSADELNDYCSQNGIEAAVVCVPDSSAKEVVDSLVSLGVKIFWNFTGYDILFNHKDMELSVENVHLNDSLMTLRYLAN
ncbi:MAG: redox-sensing transcriptional repressor Rex [Oscillospiraceae bacterium]|nr:redox-sensing transcriptional repressor Rex [Oscillospiraceae bacterium]